MIYFASTLTVQLSVWIVCTSALSDSIKGNLPSLDVISDFLERFQKPYRISLNLNHDSSLRASEKSDVENAIDKKIAELQPYLQDEDRVDRAFIHETDDNLALEGNDETTIIEFMPRSSKKSDTRKYNKETDSLRTNIKKYKQLRETIKRSLDKERAGSKTKKLITRTLDDMLSQLIESQCTWKTIHSPNLQTHIHKSHNTRKSIDKLHQLSNQEWKNMRRQYHAFLKSKQDDLDEFIKQFHEFFTSVMNRTWHLAPHYKVRCQVIKIGDETNDKEDNTNDKDDNTRVLRDEKAVQEGKKLENEIKVKTEIKVETGIKDEKEIKNETEIKVGKDVKVEGDLRAGKIAEVEKDKCGRFKVCSGELKVFLNNFYKYLNDTTVSTFRNYAAMFVRDVNVGRDKQIVISFLQNISKTVEKKGSKLFKKELEHFKLDKNKKQDANIQHISDFIKAVIDHAKKTLKKNLARELGTLKTKLLNTVKDDLNVNLKLDLDNLRKLFNDRICSIFIPCNGKYSSRRENGLHSFGPDAGNVYVKVQLTLDEDLKESLSRKSIARSWENNDLNYRFVRNFRQSLNRHNVLNVTRTTMLPSESSLSDNTTESTLEYNEVPEDRNITIK